MTENGYNIKFTGHDSTKEVSRNQLRKISKNTDNKQKDEISSNPSHNIENNTKKKRKRKRKRKSKYIVGEDAEALWEDGKYHEIIIQTVTENGYTVKFVENGTVSDVSQNQLRKIHVNEADKKRKRHRKKKRNRKGKMKSDQITN